MPPPQEVPQPAKAAADAVAALAPPSLQNLQPPRLPSGISSGARSPMVASTSALSTSSSLVSPFAISASRSGSTAVSPFAAAAGAAEAN